MNTPIDPVPQYTGNFAQWAQAVVVWLKNLADRVQRLEAAQKRLEEI